MNTKKVVSLEDIKKMKNKMRSSKDSFTETHETMKLSMKLTSWIEQLELHGGSKAAVIATAKNNKNN